MKTAKLEIDLNITDHKLKLNRAISNVVVVLAVIDSKLNHSEKDND